MKGDNFTRKFDTRGRLNFPTELLKKYKIESSTTATIIDNDNGIITIDLNKQTTCPKCNKAIPQNSNYCLYCGIRLQ